MNPPIQSLHDEYRRLTGRDVPCHIGAEYWWGVWAMQFSVEDLRLVVRYIKALIKERRRWPESFKLSNLIGDPVKFAEDLAEAKAWSRNKWTPTEKEKILEATGRAVRQSVAPRSTAQIMAGDEALKKLLETRDNL